MPKVLSEAAIARYAREGFLTPLTAFPASTAAALRARLEAHEARAGEPLGGKFRFKTHLLFTWADEMVHHPAVLDAVEDLLGPDLLCWNSSFFIKAPASAGFVSWHQDANYWGLEPDDVVTAWVALSPSNEDSGCMKVIPGTHRETQLPHVDTFHKDNLLTRGQEIAVEVDETRAVGIHLRPGEFSLHHVGLVHGSGPNRAADRRIGFAMRYIAPSVRQKGQRDSAMLVRGTDRHGHFDPESRPRADLDAAALAAHAGATERKLAVFYEGAPPAARPAPLR